MSKKRYDFIESLIEGKSQESDDETKALLSYLESAEGGEEADALVNFLETCGVKHEQAEGDEEEDADEDYDEDGEVESSEDEYKGAKDKAIKKAKEEVEESARNLVKVFDKLTEGDQERLDKSDDADKGDDKRSGEEQPAPGEKSGKGKADDDAEVDSDAGVKKGGDVDESTPLKDWFDAFCEAEDLTQDHTKDNNPGDRGTIGDGDDGDKDKDDALPDTDQAESKPDAAKKLIDKSGDEKKAINDWMETFTQVDTTILKERLKHFD